MLAVSWRDIGSFFLWMPHCKRLLELIEPDSASSGEPSRHFGKF